MNATAAPIAKFPLGDLIVTPSALNRLMQDDILTGIARHRSGDWGDIGADDRKENDPFPLNCASLRPIHIPHHQ